MDATGDNNSQLCVKNAHRDVSGSCVCDLGWTNT
jgi:hypothetical protein